MQNYNTPNLATVDDPIRSRHDIKATRQSIKQMLAGGTPDWVRFPSEYKSFVRESFQAEKEQSDRMVRQYRLDNQDELTDEKSRKVNIVRSRDIIKKLRDNGVRCFTIDNGMAGTVGLWACKPNSQEMTYVCYMQIPFMCEWSIVRLDRHGLASGESYRGWRTILAQLIVKEILTEKKVHAIFGRPNDSITSRRYRETLFNFRNGIGRLGSSDNF
jgi:hypothetical protein